jgi:hypothetical protein
LHRLYILLNEGDAVGEGADSDTRGRVCSPEIISGLKNGPSRPVDAQTTEFSA